MSARYSRLLDMLERPTTARQAAQELRTTPNSIRGMIRDLRQVVGITTFYTAQRATYQRTLFCDARDSSNP